MSLIEEELVRASVCNCDTRRATARLCTNSPAAPVAASA